MDNVVKMAITIVDGCKSMLLFEAVEKKYEVGGPHHNDDERSLTHISERVSRVEAEALLKKWKKICVDAERASTL
jgi:hypothetical protein